MCSWQTNTCFLVGNLLCDFSLQINFLWHLPSLCFPEFCIAPGNKHWMQKTCLFSSWFLSLGVISVNFFHAKYWMIFVTLGPFVATCSSDSIQKEALDFCSWTSLKMAVESHIWFAIYIVPFSWVFLPLCFESTAFAAEILDIFPKSISV